MRTKATIKILEPTKSGISRSTGNPWQSKDCVMEVAEADGGNDIVACRVWNKSVIDQLDRCEVGDVVDIDMRIYTKARPFTYKDGTQGIDRSNEISIVSLSPA